MRNISHEEYDVIVLGAGAAGLMSAITAAKKSKRILVLEKSNKVGKKILMSGGGRCNFTNRYVESHHFISNNPHFCKSALKNYTPQDFIDLVEQHEIEYEERKHHQLFCKHSAKEIVNMLLQECNDLGIEIKTECDVKAVDPISNQELRNNLNAKNTHYRYSINVAISNKQGVEQLTIPCQSLIIATGALSIPTLGGSDYGYRLAEQFNLPLIERRAGLVPFKFNDHLKNLCENLSGLSLPVIIHCNGTKFEESLLFTHKGISGPVVLQTSNYWNPGDTIAVNLLPKLDAMENILKQKEQNKNVTIRKHLNGLMPKALIIELQKLWWPGYEDYSICEISNKELRIIGAHLNKWDLKPSSTEGYKTAEVTLGGIDTDAIDSKTMEVRNQKGLYFIGEVVDVTGHLGGFNFQWAWASGYTAGLFA